MKRSRNRILRISLLGLSLVSAICAAQTPIPRANSRETKTGIYPGATAPAASSDYTFVTLDVPGAEAASAQGISSPANPTKTPPMVVGTYSDSDGNTGGFTYSINTSTFGTVTFDAESIYVNGIDNLNGLTGYFQSTATAPREGYFYSGRLNTVLKFPGASETLPYAVSFDPEDPAALTTVVGTYSDKTGGFHGLGYEGEFFTIDYPGAVSTELTGIYCCSGSGYDFIVGNFDGGSGSATSGSFLYASQTFTLLAVPGAAQTLANGISENLDIVGGYMDSSGTVHGFVSFYKGGSYGNRNYVTVDYPGAAQTFIGSVSSNGTLVGSYGPNATETSAFIAFPNAFGQVEPTSLYFGGHTIGSKTQLAVTLTNTGTAKGAALDKITAKVEGTDPNDFTVENHCAGSTLEQGQSCTIDVTFDPLATGSRAASLVVGEVNNSTGDPAVNSPQVIPLAGVGSDDGTPGAQLAPASLNFGTLLVGTSVTKSATLTNTGTGTLLIKPIGLAGNYSQSNNCGTSLAAGKSCTISLKLAPKSAGTFGGLLSVYDDVSGGRQVVSLTGAGTVVSLTPNPLGFGSTPVGGTSAPENITVENTGKVSLTISGDGITGDFHIAGGTCGKTLLASASCTYSIEFKPSQQGTRSGTFSLKDNGGGSPQNVTLTGTGT
jgi:hypothetical protein